MISHTHRKKKFSTHESSIGLCWSWESYWGQHFFCMVLVNPSPFFFQFVHNGTVNGKEKTLHTFLYKNFFRETTFSQSWSWSTVTLNLRHLIVIYCSWWQFDGFWQMHFRFFWIQWTKVNFSRLYNHALPTEVNDEDDVIEFKKKNEIISVYQKWRVHEMVKPTGNVFPCLVVMN